MRGPASQDLLLQALRREPQLADRQEGLRRPEVQRARPGACLAAGGHGQLDGLRLGHGKKHVDSRPIFLDVPRFCAKIGLEGPFSDSSGRSLALRSVRKSLKIHAGHTGR